MIYDFFTEHGFIFELLIATALFVMTLKRRNHFIWRLLLCITILMGLSLIWGLFETRYTVWDILKYSSYFMITTAMIKFCFNVSFRAALFCQIGAFATQHAAYKIGEILLFPFEDSITIFTYAAIYLTSIICVYFLFYLVFAKQLQKYDVSHFENKLVIYLSMALLMFTVIFGQYYYKDTPTLYLTLGFYEIMCCVLALWIQYGMIDSAKKEKDFKVMEHILYLRMRQMESSKENMDLINIKLHDFKHQIKNFEDRLSPHELKELQNIISIYDMSVKTGNEALDTVLAEKSLICSRANIKLNCIANGESLNFMYASDIYSLFGNAIDNAIAAVQMLDDDNKRIIAISVKKTMGMISIHFENFFTGNLTFMDDLPITTKEEKKYHGYGLRSIKLLTEKYDGFLSLKTNNNVFSLNILIPSTTD